MKALEAINSPVSVEVKDDKKYYTYKEEDVNTIIELLEALKYVQWEFELEFNKTSGFIFGTFPQKKYTILKEGLKR